VNHSTEKYYVGQHKGNNLKQYLQKKFYEADKRLGGQSRLYASMRKHGRDVCRGGEGFTGPHSSKTRKKIRTTLLGRRHTPDAIARMKANPRTEKQLVNLNRNGLRFMTDETREKLKNRPQNSQFGTCWIQLNGVEKKIKMAELNLHLQQGWVRGRTRLAKFKNKRFVTP